MGSVTQDAVRKFLRKANSSDMLKALVVAPWQLRTKNNFQPRMIGAES
jgi:hypothetical protein